MIHFTEELGKFEFLDLAAIVNDDYYSEAASCYNQGLKNARSDSLDLAGLNLRRALELKPDLACATKLLALVYAKEGEHAKGYRLLSAYLNRIQEDDEQAFTYMSEIKSLAGPMLYLSLREERRLEKKSKKKGLTTLELQNSEMFHDFLLILAGIILGGLACMYLVFPSVKKTYIDDSNQKIMSYGNELTAREVEIASLKDQIAGLEDDVAEYKSKLSAYTGKNGIMDAYAELFTALDAYADGNYVKSVKTYLKMKSSNMKNKALKKAYKSLKKRMEGDAIEALYNTGYEAYQARKYTVAISNLRYALKLKKDYPEAMFWLGLAYYNNHDKKNAQKYLYQLQTDYANTGWATDARKIMPYTPEEEQ